ncbi:NUMOD3 motif (2 copies) [Escherichia phage slur04]|uniref:Homing endonuclease n=3 Tax=Tequatrovirus TaxID=10663 RepID=Q0ILH1_BPT6|nr:homing endonuclease [Escherichia phage slur02]YP_009625445.1 homing endonuclease [Escherichia phage slur04]YP_010067375.1 homing endonuclease [Enterobacteria phage T6]CUL02999.1 NUMOD3 motif (2 copies) [Escherichia phage slur11]CUL03785.1 NUMOD3 motif (2 copies) [Escherichia phage slur13]ABI48942.1 MobE [Enterobacteria phage T6]AXN58263.1 homing endonuclease [Enterobacteria phage T6]CUL01191.1 Homing endonuclease [Enterobacteria phage JSE] [Escherichia phage slur02]
MNYQKIYNDLISRAQAREPLSEYKETHHIIPRCMGGSDDKENLVELTGREHFIAHWLLCKIYDTPGLKKAFGLMCLTGKNRSYKISSQLYELGRRRLSEAATGREVSMETREKISRALKGRKFTKEHLARMRKPKTEEAKKNIAAAKVGVLNPMYGTISPTRDVPHTKETRDLISLRTKQGTEYPPCPHCGKKVNKGNALRWHYDKCKFKDSK